MQVTIDPPMHTWRPRVPDAALIARRRAMGFTDPEKPIIATGHQAGFWHPGILAKCIAAVAFARQVGAQPLYVMVDHDANDALELMLPTSSGDRLTADTIHLGHMEPDVAVVAQYHIDWRHAGQLLHDAATKLAAPQRANLESLAKQLQNRFVNGQTLADDIADHMRWCWQASAGELPIRLATDMVDDDLVHRMLHDARRCADIYNEAVTHHRDASVPTLQVERDRVELPLWYVGNPWGAVRDPFTYEFIDWPVGPDGKQHYIPRPRQRVFADLADSKPLLVMESGDPVPWIDRRHRLRDHIGHFIGLAPRALTLTAMLRSTCCDLFIHGKGGGVYDRAMEMWWHNWTGEPLAPMAVVTADVRLDFPGVPVAEPRDVERAVWYAHHLPHNLDRHLPREVVDPSLAERKRELLAHMNDDRNRKRRAAAFREIHEINRQLSEQQAESLALAKQQVERAKAGAANLTVAMRRDWSFALYPKEKMDALKAAIARLAVGP
jgi:hypothetical protein